MGRILQYLWNVDVPISLRTLLLFCVSGMTVLWLPDDAYRSFGDFLTYTAQEWKAWVVMAGCLLSIVGDIRGHYRAKAQKVAKATSAPLESGEVVVSRGLKV